MNNVEAPSRARSVHHRHPVRINFDVSLTACIPLTTCVACPFCGLNSGNFNRLIPGFGSTFGWGMPDGLWVDDPAIVSFESLIKIRFSVPGREDQQLI